jgi:hypothetical protein
MKMSSRAEKWAAGLLGLVCLALLVNLLLPSGTRVGASRTVSPPAAAPRRSASKTPAAPKGFSDLGRYDPTVHLDALSKIREQPLPELDRNPFEFPPERPRDLRGGDGSAPPGQPVPSTPPAPSVPLKALGFTERAGSPREAIITDNDQIFIVHEGETVARRFRVLHISPTMVELEDDTTHQSIRLPISQ